jgi:hypothetical protein
MARWAPILLLLAGCVSDRAVRGDDARFLALLDDARETRDAAFQDLIRGEGAPIPTLRSAMNLGARYGYPVVALLYAQGRGDTVPLDLRARHLAAFEWPRAHASENAVVEPYVRDEVARDLVRTGRPALRPLGAALKEAAPTEGAAMRIVAAMIRIGGRAAAEEFARLLDDPRAGAAAATALLYLGRQELLLRIALPAGRVDAARQWWEVAKDFPESEWIREAAEALAARFEPKDPEDVRPVFCMLIGQAVDDPKEWWNLNRDWRPAAPPLRPEELFPALSSDRARAWDANRRLEEATGMRVWIPRMERVSELAAALRLWRPPTDLAVRWKRVVESPLLRLSIAVIGASAQLETPRVRWAYETHFHATEEESGELRIETSRESYALFVQAFDFGTRLVASESHGGGGLWTGVLREFRHGEPMVMFSAPFKAALVATVEEADGRRPTPPPAQLQSEWRARLRGWKESDDALRALAYFQDPADAELLRERKAGPGLLLLGDPAALELRPRLEPHEIEMALRKAADPRVREYLRSLKTSGRP